MSIPNFIASGEKVVCVFDDDQDGRHIKHMMEQILEPLVLAEFSFVEKMAFERLFIKYRNDWKKIASYFVVKTPMDIKRYWIQKTRREERLREELTKRAELQARAQGTKIYIRRNTSSPFTWNLVPVERSIPSDLEILANLATNLSA